MRDNIDIVQQFRATKCYWWMRHAVETVAVLLLDATIQIFFYFLGILFLVYEITGFKVATVILLWVVSMVTGWRASEWHVIETWKSAGLLDQLGVLFVGISPLFTAAMVWIRFHEDDR